MDALKLPTIQDIYNLPEGVRAELIDGHIYYMSAPSREHQEIVHQLSYEIESYIRSKKGQCKVYPSPFAVFLQNDKNYVEPDISVICDRDKLDSKGCHGAPDWIIEVISQGNAEHDTVVKLDLYSNNGVREYWIVEPNTKKVIVYNFKSNAEIKATIHGFDKVKVGIYEDLEIDFSLIEI